MATRWGICGTGLISNDFTTVLKSLPASEHQVVAVGSMSDQKKADQFATKYSIPAAYGSYLQLAKDANVEIVYVGTKHPFHREACLTFLDHGKHVLCEKPMAMNLTEVEDIIAKAKEKKLFLMEGMWTRFFPAYRAMVEELNTGNLGTITCVQANGTFFCSEILGPTKPDYPGGALLAIACYPIMYIVQIFKEYPEKIVAEGQFSEKGGDLGAVITMRFKGGALGSIYTHGDVGKGGSSVTIFGRKGSLVVHDFMHTPERVTFPVTQETRHFPLPDVTGPFNWWNSNGFVYEAQAVRQCLLKGLTECPEVSHEDSLVTMRILEEVYRQLGLPLRSS